MGPDVRFTQKGDALYAILLAKPGATVVIPGLNPKDGAEISALGGGRLEWSRSDRKLVVQTGQLPGEYAWTLKIRPAPAAE